MQRLGDESVMIATRLMERKEAHRIIQETIAKAKARGAGVLGGMTDEELADCVPLLVALGIPPVEDLRNRAQAATKRGYVPVWLRDP